VVISKYLFTEFKKKRRGKVPNFLPKKEEKEEGKDFLASRGKKGKRRGSPYFMGLSY